MVEKLANAEFETLKSEWKRTLDTNGKFQRLDVLYTKDQCGPGHEEGVWAQCLSKLANKVRIIEASS